MATKRKTKTRTTSRQARASKPPQPTGLTRPTKLITTQLQDIQVQYQNLFQAYVNEYVIPHREAGQVIDDSTVNIFTDDLRDKLLNAVRYGVDMWRLQAHFANIMIMGQTAIGNPGCLNGPNLKPWILQAPGVYNATGDKATLIRSVADAVTVNFTQWMNAVTVPGLPWYPMFVAVAAPFASPTPNVPMPLIVCVSQHQDKLMSPYQIETAIRAQLPNKLLTESADLFLLTLSAQLANYFTSWLVSQNVMMVMGMGPVPTFNPPYVPVGSVVNGYVIPSPGHLAV